MNFDIETRSGYIQIRPVKTDPDQTKAKNASATLPLALMEAHKKK